jgi:hypothetical protein
VCVIAACVATGTAFMLALWPPHGTVSVASFPAADAGAGSEPVQPLSAAVPKANSAKPIVRPERRNDPASRRRAFQQQATFSIDRGRYRSRQYCPADFNRDDVVDQADLAAYVECWQTGDEMSVRRADMNHDEVADGADMTEFLSAYFNNDCDPQRQRERRTAIRPERPTGTLLLERTGPRRTLDVLQSPADSP